MRSAIGSSHKMKGNNNKDLQIPIHRWFPTVLINYLFNVSIVTHCQRHLANDGSRDSETDKHGWRLL